MKSRRIIGTQGTVATVDVFHVRRLGGLVVGVNSHYGCYTLTGARRLRGALDEAIAEVERTQRARMKRRRSTR